MRVETVGVEPADVAIVGGIHGDEPCGIHAVETLLDADLEFERSVKFIVANERAAAENVRYVDEDLNRAFPGDPDGDTHESRLAHELAIELRGCETLALHSTQSYDGVFSLVESVGEFEREIVPQLSVDAVVETGPFSDGRLFQVVSELVEVECGLQRSGSAAANAVLLAKEFLLATDALAAETIPLLSERRGSSGDVTEALDEVFDSLRQRTVERDRIPVFRLTASVPKSTADTYQVFAANFTEVARGSTYATAGEEPYVAEEAFYPVLMSPYGYEDVFGYAAERVGFLDV